MQYQIQTINNAIVWTFAEFLDEESKMEPDGLRSLLANFFDRLAGTEDPLVEVAPDGYHCPGNDMEKLTRMCASVYASCNRQQVLLIRQIWHLSDQRMAQFRKEYRKGKLFRNSGEISSLSVKRGFWSSQMRALQTVFFTKLPPRRELKYIFK